MVLFLGLFPCRLHEHPSQKADHGHVSHCGEQPLLEPTQKSFSQASFHAGCEAAPGKIAGRPSLQAWIGSAASQSTPRKEKATLLNSPRCPKALGTFAQPIIGGFLPG